MSADLSSDLRGELLDDFYAECDELLTQVREELIQLEGAVGQSASTAALVEALFRHLHSVKGICAIVGLRPAEELAHGMEDFLRACSKRALLVDVAHVDTLLLATQRLEQVVNSHRTSQPLPSIADILAQVRQAIPAAAPVEVIAPPATAASPVSPAKVDVVQAARARGLTAYLAAFSPTPALDVRGVNVSAIRERLKGLGEILSAVPSVRGKGSIVFEFTLGLREPLEKFPEWAEDGVTFSVIAAAPTEAAPTPSTATIPKPAAPAGADFVESLSLTPSHMVRVDLARLDDLMRITGELVIHRSRLEERVHQVRGDTAGLKEINLALTRSLRELRQAVSRVRMVSVAEIFNRMPFVARDLARHSEKKVRVSLEGQQTEVDKFLVERLKEPLLHLVRNAFAHGIETPAERIAAGKLPVATILLRARSEGEMVSIQIRDDGRGIDPAHIARRANSLGLTVPGNLDSAALLKILCAPGFSTKDEADLASGRGVGMDVVANTVREMGGTLTLETVLGAWTEFTLRLPLTLSIADAIIVCVGTETCAVPQVAVEEIVQIACRELRTINQARVIPYRGGILPVVSSRAMFGLPAAPTELLTVLVLSGERGSIGLIVDRVRGQREIVIRPLVDPLIRVPGISGATELGDGRPMLILDPVAITRGLVRPSFPAASMAANTTASRVP